MSRSAAVLDHITFGVADYDRAIAFYDQALAPLGISRVFEVTREQSGSTAFAGYGDTRPFFWVGEGQATRGQFHVAFAVETRAEVDAFHAAALAAGGTDNGAPGIRAHYHPTYYGAFVLDPEGRNIEAVCHAPG
jgi:catechol 2,3-dioxygenase-like lactoylglutathione lyase family enzyme